MAYVSEIVLREGYLLASAKGDEGCARLDRSDRLDILVAEAILVTTIKRPFRSAWETHADARRDRRQGHCWQHQAW